MRHLCEISSLYFADFLELRRAGIIESIRGAQGGYILEKTVKITVSMVLTALEGIWHLGCLPYRKKNLL